MGITTMQAWIYWLRYSDRDRFLIKAVVCILLLEYAHKSLSAVGFDCLVSGYSLHYQIFTSQQITPQVY